MLVCYIGIDDVCFGYFVFGCDGEYVEGLEDVVGFFINMVIQRVKFELFDDVFMFLMSFFEVV